ncbi:hypothetical protein AC249_AIPGENE11270, partial [Exaiptasia diaphana]
EHVRTRRAVAHAGLEPVGTDRARHVVERVSAKRRESSRDVVVQIGAVALIEEMRGARDRVGRCREVPAGPTVRATETWAEALVPERREAVVAGRLDTEPLDALDHEPGRREAVLEVRRRASILRAHVAELDVRVITCRGRARLNRRDLTRRATARLLLTAREPVETRAGRVRCGEVDRVGRGHAPLGRVRFRRGEVPIPATAPVLDRA